MNSFLVVLEAAALLTARFRPGHIGELCSRGLNHLSPRYNSNYLEETSSLGAAALLTARFRSNTGLSTRRAGTRPASTVSSRCTFNFLDRI